MDEQNGCEMGRRLKDHFLLECASIEKEFVGMKEDMTDLKQDFFKKVEDVDKKFFWIMTFLLLEISAVVIAIIR